MIKRTLPALMAAVALFAPVVAHALVVVWNPGRLGVMMPDATTAEATLTTVRHCGSEQTTIDDEVTADLVVGVDLEAPLAEGCVYRVTVHDDVEILGSNSNGSFELLVDAAEFDVSSDDLPLELTYTLVTGTVASGPVLDLD